MLTIFVILKKWKNWNNYTINVMITKGNHQTQLQKSPTKLCPLYYFTQCIL